MGSRRLIKTSIAIAALLFLLTSFYFEVTVLKPKSSVVVKLANLNDDEEISTSDATIRKDDPVGNVVFGAGQAEADEHIGSPMHRVLFSLTTKDREYMRAYLGNEPATNPNLIPHPTKTSYWILIAQYIQPGGVRPSEHMSCTVGLQNDFVLCAEPVTTVPLLAQGDGNCTGNLEFVQWVWGSRDARVFYGPSAPYVIYGAQSNYICFGQWLQDARSVLDEFELERPSKQEPFQSTVELRRPSDWNLMEKNYFLFWDRDGAAYVHYTLWPKRAYSRLMSDGSAPKDLAPDSAYEDQMCMAKLLPPQRQIYHEDVHQATNSLSITLCERSDKRCSIDDSNTFIMHIFHHKSFHNVHAVYEPHIVLFKRTSPFQIYAIGQKPFWIHGRHNLTEASRADRYKDHPERIPSGHTELFYITSMSWKSHTQKYHGYKDDVLFLSFGIEDSRPGVIDILAGDHLQDLAYC